ncbi:hypothetical protein B0T25DRAFT_614839 [Lasiosphaeria hispida]|uniref:ferroxidase n=1 Tax=Lasiosphaeria hispida TaxID=260671 RepID=A0AAJ0H8V5_9PEZI|nr:hypothetical protein B0T25DRAFT_614839 [Lasiosphaeria hispida]
MVRLSLTRVAGVVRRGLQSPRAVRFTSPAIFGPVPSFQPRLSASVSASKFISSSADRKGITPDDKPPTPREPVAIPVVKTPAEISDSEYHAVADEFMERLLNHLEELEDARDDVDVEYSAGVLNIRFGPDIGTYVVNKQPPNKQIWLSSPKSGPKRYDYVLLGDGQNDKQETACGEWLYLRDNSTIAQIFEDELGIDLKMPIGHYGE